MTKTEWDFNWPAGWPKVYADPELPHQIKLVNDGTSAIFVTCNCGGLRAFLDTPDADEALACWRSHMDDVKKSEGQLDPSTTR